MKLPTSWIELKKLEKIVGKSERVVYIPNSIGKLTNLRELYLKGKPLSSQEIDKIRKLLPRIRIYFR